MILSFDISAPNLDGLEMKRLRRAIEEQADAQDIIARTTQNSSTVSVVLQGDEDHVRAYEAAVKCWASNR